MSKLYDLENIKKYMKKEFGDKFKLPGDNELTFQLLFKSLKDIYTDFGQDYVNTTKSESELMLSEIEDDSKNDLSVAYTALLLSLFTTGVSAMMTFLGIANSSKILGAFQFSTVAILYVLLVATILVFVLLGSTIYRSIKTRRLKLERQYLKFKLNCINICFNQHISA